MRSRLQQLLRFPAFALGVIAVGSGQLEKSTAEDKVWRIVNGAEVKDSDIDTFFRITFGPTFSQRTSEERATIRINRWSQATGQYMDRVLLVTAAQATGQKCTEAEINLKVDQLKSGFPAGMDLDAYLKGTGITQKAFRTHAEEQVVIDKLAAFKTKHVKPPSKEEVIEYYREHPEYFNKPERARVRHILISTSDAISDEQRARKRAEAEIVRRKLLADSPERFTAYVSQYSHCPTKAQGGDLGVIEKGKTRPEFDRAVFSQKVGEIGKVVRSPKGYHILQVIERFPSETLTLLEAERDIISLLDYKARDEVMKTYLKQLRLSATVKLPEPEKKK